MPDSNPRYVALALHWPHAGDTPGFLTLEGKLVLIDTLDLARWVAPALAPGRLAHWNAAGDEVAFSPLSLTVFNRISLCYGYDPYDVPGGFRREGIWSEGKGRDWRYHVPYFHVKEYLFAWAEQMAIQIEEENVFAPLPAA